MSAGTAVSASGAGTGGVTALRVLHSEWIKLITVRSTVWTTAVALAVAAGVCLLLGAAVRPEGDGGGIALTGASVSLNLVALVVGVLGVLTIGGEYATLQIRSSYAAVPARWPALVAKAVVVAAWSFVVGLVVSFGGWAVVAALLAAKGVPVAMTGGAVGALVGGGVWLAVVAAFAVGLGAVVRSSAAGITILAALLFVLPTIVSIVAVLSRAQWLQDAQDRLLSNAGAVLFAAPGTSGIGLGGALVALACWLAAAWVPAVLLTRSRDV